MYVLILMITPAACTHTHDRSVVRVFKVITFFTSTDRTDYDSNARAARENFLESQSQMPKTKLCIIIWGATYLSLVVCPSRLRPSSRRLSRCLGISPIARRFQKGHELGEPASQPASCGTEMPSFVSLGWAPVQMAPSLVTPASWWFQVRKPHLLVWHFCIYPFRM